MEFSEFRLLMESFGFAEECSGCVEKSFGFGNVLAVGFDKHMFGFVFVYN